MRSQRGLLTFCKQLQVLSLHRDSTSVSDLAGQFNVHCEVLQSILDREESLLSVPRNTKQCVHLKSEDKLKVLFYVNRSAKNSEPFRRFGVSPRSIGRIKKDRSKLLQMDRNKVHLYVPRNLYAKYPAMENKLVGFTTFACEQRLLVSSSILRTRAIDISKELGIVDFEASNGWLSRFLIRTPIQPSFKLHGKGNSNLPQCLTQRMEEIRSIYKEFPLSNIYNVDESGLFFRMGPWKTYLSVGKMRDIVRSTDFSKHKDRVTTVLARNAGEYNLLPTFYIGSSEEPSCFRTGRLETEKRRYWSQKKGWMDSQGFQHWVKWWYNEVRARSNGPWLLIMDNCGGHELEFTLPGVRIELLLPRCTAKCQPLDLGFIDHSKMRYSSVLLRTTTEVMLKRGAGSPLVETLSNRGVRDIEEGSLLHVGVTMRIFDKLGRRRHVQLSSNAG